jgi:hypothetical protein
VTPGVPTYGIGVLGYDRNQTDRVTVPPALAVGKIAQSRVPRVTTASRPSASAQRMDADEENDSGAWI